MTRHDLLTNDGITQTIVEWALDYGVPESLIMQRLHTRMSVARAITTPMRARPGDQLPEPPRSLMTLTLAGQTKTMSEWAAVLKIPVSSLRSRITSGWSTEEALTTPSHSRRGVVSNLPASVGTGGGRTVQESTNIGISE